MTSRRGIPKAKGDIEVGTTRFYLTFASRLFLSASSMPSRHIELTLYSRLLRFSASRTILLPPPLPSFWSAAPSLAQQSTNSGEPPTADQALTMSSTRRYALVLSMPGLNTRTPHSASLSTPFKARILRRRNERSSSPSPTQPSRDLYD